MVGLLVFESKTNADDYHYEMNGDTFYSWFNNSLPLLKDYAVTVMDNASYHSVKKDTFPLMWKKEKKLNGWRLEEK